MKIDIYTSNLDHPVVPFLARWVERNAARHQCRLTADRTRLDGGDILFLMSVGEIIKRDVREHYRATIVIHPSDLPRGRGWSPQVWAIAAGATEIVVTAIEAVDQVDAGPIWAQVRFPVARHELVDEIHATLFAAEVALMDEVLARLDSAQPQPQATEGASYHRKRTPEDSRIDPERSIAAQFDLLRICDPDRYPAFFDLHGHRYSSAAQSDAAGGLLARIFHQGSG